MPEAPSRTLIPRPPPTARPDWACISGCPIGRQRRRSGRAHFFSQYLGACRRRPPRARVDLKVPKDASHQDISHAALRVDLAVGGQRRHPTKVDENKSALGDDGAATNGDLTKRNPKARKKKKMYEPEERRLDDDPHRRETSHTTHKISTMHGATASVLQQLGARIHFRRLFGACRRRTADGLDRLGGRRRKVLE